LKYALRIVGEWGYLSGVLPKLDMMPANQLLCLIDGYFVIRTFEQNWVLKLATWADDIRAILRHVAAPLW
jgi:hypothetical protein